MITFSSCKRNNSDKEKVGIRVYNEKLALNGYTVVDDTRKCMVIDMNGDIVYRVPGGLCVFLPSREIIAKDEKNLMLFDKDFNLKWKTEMLVHHEITLSPDSNIFLLSTDIHEYMGEKVRFDVIYGVTMTGDIFYKWSTYDNLPYIMKFISDGPATKFLPEKYDSTEGIEPYITQDIRLFLHKDSDTTQYVETDYEFFHMNSIFVLDDNPLQEKNLAFKKGNLLITINDYGFIAVLNPETSEFTWIYYLDIITQSHSISMLKNGNILLYVNSDLNNQKPYSNVIELEPIAKQVVWDYRGTPPESFCLSFLGACVRLSNGNTLISDYTMGGRVFEVTPDKQIVWDWLNPEFDEEDKKPAGVYRSKRISKEFMNQFIEPL